MKPKDFTVDVNCPECKVEVLTLVIRYTFSGTFIINYSYYLWVYCNTCNERVNIHIVKAETLING